MTLGLLPEQALLNDINPHVINFYRWLKRGFNTSLKMTNNQTRFYDYRRKFNDLITNGGGKTAEAAALFYYLNRTCYNGLCRFNQSGEFNVPFGRYETINYRYDFLAYKAVFKNWKFSNTHFGQVPLQPTDFIYADPPYDVEFRQYSKGGFGWEEQEKTAEWLSKHPGPVVLSNQATKRVVELYRDYRYKLVYLRGPRRISCTGDRTPADEVLALRNLT